MPEEEKDENKVYILNDDSKIDFEKSGNDFDIMPDEFFNAQYQQSRVRKEQQMQREKDLIDKKKKEKEEKLKKLSELEKQRKEKDEFKKERFIIKEKERLKKQEEENLINEKRKHEQDLINQEKDRIKKEKEEIIKKKLDREKRIRELNQKGREERRSLQKDQREILRQELEKREAILKSQNKDLSDEDINKEVERSLSKDRVEILKKIKLEQNLNLKEQKRIEKEFREEEKKALEESKRKALEDARKSLKNRNPLSLVLSKIDSVIKKDDNKKNKKIIFIVFYSCLAICFVLFISIQTKIIDLSRKTPIKVVDNTPIVIGNNLNTPSEVKVFPNKSSIVSDSGNAVEYSYKYDFSKFFDFFKYSINDDSIGNYLSSSEKSLYKTDSTVLDSDSDGHIDGEEIMNLYDPSVKNNGESLDLRLIDSAKIVSYVDNKISVYYPSEFYQTSTDDDSFIISPILNSNEYFKLEFIKNELGISLVDYLKQQDQSSTDFYSISSLLNTMRSDFIFNNLGNMAYLDLGNDTILKVSYILPSLDKSNYAATFLMILKSINIIR